MISAEQKLELQKETDGYFHGIEAEHLSNLMMEDRAYKTTNRGIRLGETIKQLI
jgi:hypothetical protein